MYFPLSFLTGHICVHLLEFARFHLTEIIFFYQYHIILNTCVIVSFEMSR